MIKTIRVLVTIFITSFILLPVISVFAEDHVHDWHQYQGAEFKNINNATKHEVIYKYYCIYANCYEEKTESELEDHDLSVDYNRLNEYKQLSDTQHKIIIPYYCRYCLYETTMEETSNHSLERDYDKDIDYVIVSDKQHKILTPYQCSYCDYILNKEEVEDHNLVRDYSEEVEYIRISNTQHKIVTPYCCTSCNYKTKIETIENHDLLENYEKDEMYIKVSDTQHKLIRPYYCSNCGFETQIEDIEDHYWVDDSKGTEWNSISDSQHGITSYYCCKYCDAKKQETINENHYWEVSEDGSDYEKISKNYHNVVYNCYCDECRARKTVVTKEKHRWVDSGEYEYKKCSAEKHSCVIKYECSSCNAIKKETVKKKHKFDSYGYCKLCECFKVGTVCLKQKKKQKVNPETWCKVNAKKNGYLIIKTEKKNVDVSLYDKKKKKYPEVYLSCDSTNKYSTIVPVTKGVYYLKCDDKAIIWYEFKKDPSKKNYSMKTAVNLKKNKLYTTLIYSKAKRNTWSRVFKIVLKKPQKISFSGNSEISCVYDYKGNYYVETVTDYDKNGKEIGSITNDKLQKGTYYILISDSWGSTDKKYTTGNYYTVKWK